jgi:RNA polymerase sigma-70 factor (ECF subfamily)
MEDDDGTDRVTAVTDALLLQRFREGDEGSFEALFLRHYDMVYGVLFRMTGTRAEAEDLAQEVFLKLYQRPLRRDENVAGWLYRVAINAGYNALRAGQRRARREQHAGRETPPSPTPEDQAVQNETRRAVLAALAEINPRSAKLLVLREMGFSYGELAEIIKVAPGSVGKLLARAREAFEVAYRRRVPAGHEEGKG